MSCKAVVRGCVHAEKWCDREHSLPAQREHRTGAFALALISAAIAAASPCADVSTAAPAAPATVETAAVATAAAAAAGMIAATVCAVHVRAGRGTVVLASQAIGAQVASVVTPVREAAVATHAAAAVTSLPPVDRKAADLPPTCFAGSVPYSAAA